MDQEQAKQLIRKGAGLAKRSGVYKSEKRKKELSRYKKQDEKRKKRLQKNIDSEQEPTSDNSGHADDEHRVVT